MKRKRVRPSKDKKVFRSTANKTRQINVKPTLMRGGIRL